MSGCHFDHIVITAPSLAVGEEYVGDMIGVRPSKGGEHVAMGTHNSLLRLGETVYLEVIAVDPAAAAPQRRRWFDLDAFDETAAPRLATWVVRTDNLGALVAGSLLPWGEIVPMQRGTFDWLITIPRDGSLLAGGVVPTLIQWTTGGHPVTTMPESGCSLGKLEGFHPEAERLLATLDSLRLDDGFELHSLAAHERPHLVAHIQTPAGIKQLGGP